MKRRMTGVPYGGATYTVEMDDDWFYESATNRKKLYRLAAKMLKLGHKRERVELAIRQTVEHYCGIKARQLIKQYHFGLQYGMPFLGQRVRAGKTPIVEQFNPPNSWTRFRETSPSCTVEINGCFPVSTCFAFSRTTS